MPNHDDDDRYAYHGGYEKHHRLLAIAVDNYPGNAIPRLSTAVNGARALEHCLTSLGLRFRPNPVILLNERATRENILLGLSRLQIEQYSGEECSPRARAKEMQKGFSNTAARECGTIIYLAGHGILKYARDGAATAYFVPYVPEITKLTWDWVAQNCIPLDTFTDARMFMASKHVLFIFDCCFAGAALTRSVLSLQAIPAHEARGRHRKHDKANARNDESQLKDELTARCAFQVLAAGRYEQEVLDVRGPGYDLDGTQLTQSMFTGHLLQQLPAAADDFGLITADSLAFHLKDHLGRVLQSHVDQMPAYGYLPGHDGGDYVLGTGRRQTERTSSPLKQRKGVIVLVSPSSAVSSDMDRAPGIYAREFIGKDKTQWSGIEYHRCNDLDKEKETTLPLNPARGGGPLKHLWLVYTESSEPVASEMRGSYEMLETVDVHLVPLNDAYNVQETFQALANILDNVGAQGLSLEDVIVDVTGGTTPMSIGAGLACKQKADGTSRPSPCKMQYCQPNHLAFAGGRPDTTRLTVPVLLDDPIHTEKDDS